MANAISPQTPFSCCAKGTKIGIVLRPGPGLRLAEIRLVDAVKKGTMTNCIARFAFHGKPSATVISERRFVVRRDP